MPRPSNNATEASALAEGHRRRRLFCDEAVKGALAMFSPHSRSPRLAVASMALAARAAEATLGLATLSRQDRSAFLASSARAVASRAASFDTEIERDRVPAAEAAAWREALVDAYVVAAGALEPRARTANASGGPAWLIPALVARHPLSPADGWASAEILAKHGAANLSGVAACLPEGACLFSIGPSGTSPLGQRLASQWPRLRSEAVARWARGQGPGHAMGDRLAILLGDGCWVAAASPNAKALRSSFAELSGRVDSLAAAACFACAPSLERAAIAAENRLAKLPRGSLGGADALCLMLAAPDDGLALTAAAMFALAEPSADLLMAGLSRQHGALAGERGGLASANLAMARELAASSPEALLAPRPGGSSKSKTLGSNAFELALRCALSNKPQFRPEERQSIEDILELCLAAGFDPEAPDEHGATAMGKARESAAANSPGLVSLLESLSLRRLVASPTLSARPRPSL